MAELLIDEPSCTSDSTAGASTFRWMTSTSDLLPTTAQIKHALAVHLDVPEAKLRDYVVDRHQTGNLTVRPEAVFG